MGDYFPTLKKKRRSKVIIEDMKPDQAENFKTHIEETHPESRGKIKVEHEKEDDD
jgi:hypothetical protein